MVGGCCPSGWIDVGACPSRAAAILALAARLRRPAFHPTASFRASSPLHQHGLVTSPPFRDAPIQTGTAIRPHTPLQAMTQFNRGPFVHRINLRRAADSCQTMALTRLRARAHT